MSAPMIRVAVAGAAGKMGATVCDAVMGADDMELTGRADPALGTTLAEVLPNTDVVVDFTRPDTALQNALECVAAGVHVVIGTTGFDVEPLRAARGANVFIAPNFAIGAVLMMRFAAEAARHFAKAEIIELHHDRKLDKPSGTAARTAELMAAASGKPAPPVHSVRLPGMVANQEVILGDVGQTLTIRHDTVDRVSFMPGVLLAVRKVGSLTESPVVGLEHLL
ncbi:MAG TPA: dihydrodipicolinate reductase C-terminal domain-containing protein [Conexibacter sp.]|nr:dihydrodipicolinate reductase C-terminal domain-containing protein [Conexibacter sp.]